MAVRGPTLNIDRVAAEDRSPTKTKKRGGNRGRSRRREKRQVEARIRDALPLVAAIQAAEDELRECVTDRGRAWAWERLRAADARLRRAAELVYVRYHADPAFRGQLQRLAEAAYMGHTAPFVKTRKPAATRRDWATKPDAPAPVYDARTGEVIA